MAFQVSARTILQLGAELISSDGVAFYELIKNAFDAGSRKVEIELVIPVAGFVSQEVAAELRELDLDEDLEPVDRELRLNELRGRLLDALNEDAPTARRVAHAIDSAEYAEQLAGIAEQANYIEIRDSGSGMSLKDLQEIYLTIGTAHRARQRDAAFAAGDKDVRILGEKGLGRLSTMRLGSRLHVRTARAADKFWNTLDIDWDEFANASDSKLISDIPVSPRRGERKSKSDEHGTTIRVTSLRAEWSRKALQTVVDEDFARLTDPFVAARRFPIEVHYNGLPVSVPRFEKRLFEHAHATVEAELTRDSVTGCYELFTTIVYRPPTSPHEFRREYRLRGAHLYSVAGHAPEGVLASLGPWKLRFYWYNRRVLTRIEGIGDLKAVRNLLRQWAGGIAVYRDGFRVHPYGGPEDDWLDLDRKALASSGFKVNRAQIVGKLDIRAKDNPNLVDQTNREGLQDNREKTALRELLRHVLTQQFRAYLDEVDNQLKAATVATLADVADRLLEQDRRLTGAVDELLEEVPEIGASHPALLAIRESLANVQELFKDAQRLAEAYDQGRGQLVNLASIGLTVEIIAHELTRATTSTLRTLKDVRKGSAHVEPDEFFRTLEAQLNTISKRLRILDPLSTAGRQHKETFDLIDWVRDILRYHEAQFRRHNIRCEFRIVPRDRDSTMKVHMVKGMVVQVLENLLSNSVYWLKQRARYGDEFAPKITVQIDTRARELRVTDNGPGVDPDRAELIFVPFNSTKPAREGKGLGLYVSREIAEYNAGALFMEREPGPDGMLHTFIFRLPEGEA